MTATTEQRIEALDAKQAIHIVNKLIESVSSTSPQISSMNDEQQLAFTEKETGIKPRAAAADLPAEEAGALAKDALRILAQTRGGDAFVGQALDMWFDTKADFGLISVPIGIALVWFLGAADIEFTIGAFHFKKEGLTGAQQAEVAKTVLPAVVKAATGLAG